jgi:hypothetical protein
LIYLPNDYRLKVLQPSGESSRAPSQGDQIYSVRYENGHE